jgi:tetratricopeptide (TPR) repeat protein
MTSHNERAASRWGGGAPSVMATMDAGGHPVRPTLDRVASRVIERVSKRGASMPGSHPSQPFDRGAFSQGRLPLVGRSAELQALESLLESSPRQVPAAFLSGEGGSGKTRIVEELALRAERRGWSVALGRAYPVERGVPFALFSDALLPLLHGMDSTTLAVLSRGGEAELSYLFPALGAGPGGSAAEAGTDPDEFRTRLFWNFAEFLKSYARRNPMLILLEDLHWADASSMELLHFVVRHLQDQPVFFVATYDDAERERNVELPRTERSLLSLGLAQTHCLAPLTRDHVTEIVCRLFGVEPNLVREFSAMLFGWTRGNPFFVEETLKSLVSGGELTNQKGTWVGWDARSFGLPGSIRDVVTSRLSAFSERAQTVAELTAVISTRAGYPILRSVSQIEEGELLRALEELVAHQILMERDDGGEVVFDFVHPVVRETLYRDLGLQRTRMLHGAIALALEEHWREEAIEHADALAYHFARSDAVSLNRKAVTYLAAAGQQALNRHAEREAAEYLEAALERERRSGADLDDGVTLRLHRDLGRAYLRLAQYETATGHWAIVAEASAEGTAAHASSKRLLALSTFWCGRHQDALAHLAEGLASAEVASDDAQAIHIRLVLSHCLQELGRGNEALFELETALPIAQALGDNELLARVHRSLALLQIWIGPPDAAERHALEAIELARQVQDLSVEFWARWGLAVLKGMTGDTASMAACLEEANDLADKLRSPVLRLWTAEMTIEMAYATGDWQGGVALAEQAVALARRMNQKPLLPRLLVLASLFQIGRGDVERAKSLVDEACAASGMDEPDGPKDVHRIVPAYTGLAHYLVALGDYADAITTARNGLAITEGTGYTPWPSIGCSPSMLRRVFGPGTSTRPS